MDAVGTNIRLDSRGRQVLRALPRVNDDVNEEWATDKTRHAVDGLVRRRLDQPYIRKYGKPVAATWDEAFARIAEVGKSAAGSVADRKSGVWGKSVSVSVVLGGRSRLRNNMITNHEECYYVHSFPN